MFSRLQWRPDRVDHIASHDFTPEEVEEAVFEDADRKLFRGPRSQRDRSRYIYYVYGRTQEGRYVLVVLLDLGERQALPVTARDMSQAERRLYGR